MRCARLGASVVVVMHYLQFFKLNAEPFSQALASEYFYGSAEHSRVLDCLAYAAESRKGLALVTGPIGHGKSTLARRFLNSLPEDDYSAGMIVMVHGGVTAHWLLRHVATTLGIVNPVNEKLHLLSQIHERLLEIERLGKRAVVLVDEAQMLDSRELMEELRGLLNMESSRGKLVTLILFGLPEIVDHLALDPPLAQRVALRSNLGSLSLGEVEEYINHRMRIAGVAGKTFSMAVLREIYRWTTGVPRLINTLCDNVLLELFFRRERFPDPPLVAHVAIQLGLAGEMNQAQLVNDTITVPLPPASPPIESPGGDEEDKSATHELEEGLGFSPDEIASNVAQEVLAPFEEQEAFEMEAGEELIEIEDPKPQ